MASRTYLASLGRLSLASSSRVIIPAVACRRTYASAAAIATNKNRPPATAKKTASTGHLSSASNPKLSTKTASRTHVSAGGPTAKAAAKTSTPVKASGRGTVPAKDRKQDKAKALTSKEQLEGLDNMLKFSDNIPMTDVWGQKAETLDVIIPQNIITSRDRLNGLKGTWTQFLTNRQNDLKNMVSLLALAQANAIPGVNTGYDSFFKRMFQWPLYMFGARSTKESSWLATTRSLFLDTYKDLHYAIAKNDLKAIRRLTTDSFAIDTINTQKKHNTDLSYIWRFHREVNPTQIVSLRCIEAYLASEEPKIGNRLMVHALVKFDTEQSLEIYDRKGNALHQPAQGATARDVAVGGPIPAVKRNVVQYFVFEKRMWYDGPWVIREQIWDVTPTKTK